MVLRALSWFILSTFALVACGDDSEDDGDGLPETETCGVTAEVDLGQGAVPLGGKDQAICAWGPSSGDGVAVTFVTLDGPTVQLVIDEITMGEVGTFPASVSIAIDDVEYDGDCEADITEHSEKGPSELGTDYQLRGEVTCSAALESLQGQTLTVDSLSFASTATWSGS